MWLAVTFVQLSNEISSLLNGPWPIKQEPKVVVSGVLFCLQLNFVVSDYMTRQHEMSVNMRAILVDWLVEVQQSFELVHETLYLAVKLTDFYLDRQTTTVAKNLLQLIGSTALNVACKFEVYITQLLFM